MKKEGKKIIGVLSGAGISAESGLATFRQSDGLWASHKIEEVCTPEALERDPEKVIKFYNKRRIEAAQASPNQAHYILAELEEEYDIRIITQNVDDLHERAGSSHIIHLHGELSKCASKIAPYTPLPLPNGRLEMNVNDVDEAGNRLRPFIVFFGEQVPKLEEAIKVAQEADIFIIIGTSLQVYPASGLIDFVKKHVPIYLIDPAPVRTYREVTHIKEGASKGMMVLRDLLRHQSL